MRKLSVSELVTRLEYSFILKASLILIGFGMLIASLTFIVWATFFRSQTKLITGINLYTQPVIVTVTGQKMELQPFDSYSFSITQFEHVTVEVADTNGNTLTTRTHNLSRAATISIDILSDKDSAKYCFAVANVQAIYYSDKSATTTPTDIKVINDEGMNSVDYPVTAISSTTLAPGLYDGHKLPGVIDRQQHVWGIFPVGCNNVSDTSAMARDIMTWISVTPAQQRELFAQKQAAVMNSPEYNH